MQKPRFGWQMLGWSMFHSEELFRKINVLIRIVTIFSTVFLSIMVGVSDRNVSVLRRGKS